MNQSWQALLSDPVALADATAYASSNSLADVSPAPQTQLLVGSSGENMRPGNVFRIKARAKFSNTATPTLLLGIYYGGVAGTKLCAIGATTTTVSAVNWPIDVEAIVTCRSVGSSGSVVASGFVDLATSLTAVTRIPMDASAVAAVTVDTTAQKALTLGAQWSANSSSNTLTVVQFFVEQLN